MLKNSIYVNEVSLYSLFHWGKLSLFIQPFFFLGKSLSFLFLILLSENLINVECFYFFPRLTVPDLRPNVGLFWYFFTEMFEHFRPLFVCAFQINALFLYVVPLSFRLYEEPMLLATSLTALSAIFKSYPSVGDVGFYLSLLPMWKHLFHCKSHVFNQSTVNEEALKLLHFVSTQFPCFILWFWMCSEHN